MKGAPVNRWVDSRKREKYELKRLCEQRGELPPVVRHAICFSDICDKNGCTTGRVIPDVPIYATDCPICGHALWWKTKIDYESLEKKRK